MAEAKTWRFEQLGGERKSFELAGWAAPHGRPRQGAVVSDGLEIRKTEYFYPGNEAGPTRHVFGRRYKPFELNGRFRDRSDGQNFAKAQTEMVKAFVADQQRVRVGWGDIVSIEGFIESFVPGRESEGEVEWQLKIAVDVDLLAKPKKRTVSKPVDTSYIAKLIAGDLAQMLSGIPHTPGTDLLEGVASLIGLPSALAGSFLEAIDSLVSQVTGAFGKFQSACNDISNIEKATFAQLNRLATTATQLQGALAALRETYTNAGVDAALLTERSLDQAKHWSGQSAAELAMLDIAAQLGEVNRVVSVQLAGKARRSYKARHGDTWESIATAMYGAPGRANDIRNANGVGPGEAPIPGREYVIPQ